MSSFELESTTLPLTFYSSFFFLVISVSLFLLQEEVYGVLFGFLFVTSLVYRIFPHVLTLILDKLAIMYVVLYGAEYFWESIQQHRMDPECIVLISFIFLTVLYLYYGGYWMSKYCFDSDKALGEMWHAFVHMLSCFGHVMIVILRQIQ